MSYAVPQLRPGSGNEPSMVKLIIEDDEGKTTVVPLIRDEITIGRKEGNTIRLTERNVSRRHAKILKQNGTIFIEDLSSYNGIRINGNRITGRVAVIEGDRIQIGDYVLGLKLEGLAEASWTTSNSTEGRETKPFSSPEPVSLETTIEIVQPPAAAIQDSFESKPVSPAKSSTPEEKSAPRPLPAARLVCVSVNFASQEWILDKPLIVLGRTEDNDIVINHRSISRHHARVVVDRGRYTIIDLQSSNGIRVNGEEYGKVELRRGDLVDLGHVRLRFVAPGEKFNFATDATVVDISQPEKSHKWIWGLLSLGLALVVGGLIWRLSTPDTITPGISVDYKSIAPEPKMIASPKADSSSWSSQISDATNNEQWGTVIQICEQLAGESRIQLQAACEKAILEKAAKENFEKFNQAALQHQYLDVLRYWQKIPDISLYKQRDLQIVANAKSKYLDQAKKTLQSLIQEKACKKAKNLLAEIHEADPEDSEATQLVEKCENASTTIAVHQPRPQPRRERQTQPNVSPKKAAVVESTANQNTEAAANKIKQMIQQATDAYVAGNHKRAIDLSGQALRLSPKNKEAIQILGASACFLKNKESAQWAFDSLAPQARNLLKRICLSHGIELE